MLPCPLYQFCPNLQPFVEFKAILNHKIISYIGYEWYCSIPECDCALVNIIICEKKPDGKALTWITYGWKDFNYYIKALFTKEEAKDFTEGSLLKFLEPRNERNNAILAGFQKWLSIDTSHKKILFENRYQQFISAVIKS